ncbi:hypothetical protein FF098_007650 [Parvularcula flava]|uniref:HNH nuclease domain-containing protein n=1 Tax=Aquisalinus luteolus TaxID=1566827 RepID=A0A8J3EPC7_9PROT|nr:HNH endonuclease [Aquisalinus luteolus]NHK27771.1 hypothetical protein [Aquisalinus luteolus]GGH96450.1 hypothetical protein GCM10011355_15380 [Aquisalinus luteolus]
MGNELETPIFKYLTKNDLSQSGHQAGPVIPLSLIWYFPLLATDTISPSEPTNSISIRVAGYKNGLFIGSFVTRFQYQTWGGTRKPEYRVTGNLKGLLENCQEEDLLLIHSTDKAAFRYRFELLSKGSPLWRAMADDIDRKLSSGIIAPSKTKFPSGYFGEEFRYPDAYKEEYPRIRSELLIDPDAQFQENLIRRKQRSSLFRLEVLESYGGKCAVTADQMKTIDLSNNEVEAAHIIPREYNGSNVIQNGISLNRRLHWAFDCGLWCVKDDFTISVKKNTSVERFNQYLYDLDGKRISLPNDVSKHPSQDAFAWHRENIFEVKTP